MVRENPPPPYRADPSGPPLPPPRRRNTKGARSHKEILRAAAQLASVEGLEGLSIAALATHVGLSKSGLFAHFRSKEELQLETIEAATEIFDEEVTRPAMAEREGLPRLRALAYRFLDHLGRGTFPGGCFFASVASEVDGHPGALRDRIAAVQKGWLGLLEQCVVHAQKAGGLARRVEARQVAFELQAMLAGGHATFLLQGDAKALDRARRGVETLLACYGGPARAARAKAARKT